jgi:hypothetical protein
MVTVTMIHNLSSNRGLRPSDALGHQDFEGYFFILHNDIKQWYYNEQSSFMYHNYKYFYLFIHVLKCVCIAARHILKFHGTNPALDTHLFHFTC